MMSKLDDTQRFGRNLAIVLAIMFVLMCFCVYKLLSTGCVR